MVWAKIDDEILDNPKIAKAGIFGFALHIAAITWCCRNLTDGFIPHARVRSLLDFTGVMSDPANPAGVSGADGSMGGRDGADEHAIAGHLVDIDLWADVEGGYQIHDFLEYNPSREKVLGERERGRARAKKSASAEEPPKLRVKSARRKAEVPTESGSASNGPDPVPDPVPTLPTGESSARACETPTAPDMIPEGSPYTLDTPIPEWALGRLAAIAMTNGVKLDCEIVWRKYISNRLNPGNPRPRPINAFDFNGWICDQVRIERRDKERERDMAQERANRPASVHAKPWSTPETPPAPYHGVDHADDAERERWAREARERPKEERVAAARGLLAVLG